MEVTFNQKQNTEVFFLRSKNSTENPNMISEARQKFEIVFLYQKTKYTKNNKFFLKSWVVIRLTTKKWSKTFSVNSGFHFSTKNFCLLKIKNLLFWCVAIRKKQFNQNNRINKQIFFLCTEFSLVFFKLYLFRNLKTLLLIWNKFYFYFFSSRGLKKNKKQK